MGNWGGLKLNAGPDLQSRERLKKPKAGYFEDGN
jgi:hypothetical protein